MVIIIIEQLLAKRKKSTDHYKQTDMWLAKRLGFIRRLFFNKLGLSCRYTSTARELHNLRLSCKVSLPPEMPGMGNDV